MVQYQVMILAFFESIKYAGHLLPLSFLRIYLGYYFFDRAFERTQGDFLVQPRLAALLTEWLPRSTAATWYHEWVENVMVPNWKVFAYLITYVEFMIAVSLLLGFLVRPTALLGILLCLNFIYGIGQPAVELHQIHLVLFIVMFWFGAGRCLGMDYFFYKRHRGLWW